MTGWGSDIKAYEMETDEIGCGKDVDWSNQIDGYLIMKCGTMYKAINELVLCKSCGEIKIEKEMNENT